MRVSKARAALAAEEVPDQICSHFSPARERATGVHARLARPVVDGVRR